MKRMKILLLTIIVLMGVIVGNVYAIDGELGVEEVFSISSSAYASQYGSGSSISITDSWYPTLNGLAIEYLEFFTILSTIDPTMMIVIEELNRRQKVIEEHTNVIIGFSVASGVLALTGTILMLAGIGAPDSDRLPLLITGSSILGVSLNIFYWPILFPPQFPPLIGKERANLLVDRYNETLVDN